MFQAAAGCARQIARAHHRQPDRGGETRHERKQHGEPLPRLTRASAIEPGHQHEESHHEAGNHECTDDFPPAGKVLEQLEEAEKYQSGRGM